MQGYLYDPHTHTAETSKCGHLPAADVVERYVKHGFSGLVVTDHLHPEYLSRIDTEHDWQKAMDHYLSGYKASKKRGDELGFDVILGAELRFYDKFHNEVLIIHAHPYRDGNTTVFEDAVDGTEIINGNPRHENHSDRGVELCRRHPNYFRLAGSDTHQDGDDARAGVILPERVRDSFQYKAMIESGNFRLWGPDFQDLIDIDEEMRQGK